MLTHSSVRIKHGHMHSKDRDSPSPQDLFKGRHSCLFTRLFLLSAGCSRSRDKNEGLFLDSVLFLWVSL